MTVSNNNKPPSNRDHNPRSKSKSTALTSSRNRKSTRESISINIKRLSTIPQNEEDVETAHSLLLIVWGLLANIIFLIGCISFLGFTILEFNGRDRSRKANIYYGIAFSSFFLNGLLELLIDLFSTRTFRHGRYTSQKPEDL